jgi:Leucine-rich repeat (LRR) protein
VFIGEHPGLYKVFKLTCDWAKFLDAQAQAPVFTNEASQTPILYQITFELSSTFNQNHPKYTHLDENFLKGFKVRSLTMRKLNLISINDRAFNKESFGTHLRALDLSNNSISRLDAHMLEHLDRMESLILSNNDLTFGESNFIYNPRLKKLDLSNNKINVLATNIFLNLERLEEIDLKGIIKE